MGILNYVPIDYGNEILGISGMFFFMTALSLGSLSLVNTIVSLKPFFVFLIAIFLSVSFPRMLKEEIDGKIIVVKIIAIIFVVIGSILII